MVCGTCREQIDQPDSMWNPQPAVQVMAWRLLIRLSSEHRAQDLLDKLCLEDDVRTRAEAGVGNDSDDENAPTPDCNGTALQTGDRVQLSGIFR